MQSTIDYIRQLLSPAYPRGEIQAFIRLIFEEVCGYSPADLIIYKNSTLSETDRKKIETIVDRLARHEPIQYIFGRTRFMGLSFEVAAGVLIPRPETEELAEWIIQENHQQKVRILDIGTGSGCIAIALAHRLPLAEVHGCDISEEALKQAQNNNHKLGTSVYFRQMDILNPDPKAFSPASFDILVSNPPYICEEEQPQMEPNVVNFEPREALFVPDNDPLLFYRAIAVWGRTLLADDGKLYFEINSRFGQETVQMLHSLGYQQIRLQTDLSGLDRMVTARK